MFVKSSEMTQYLVDLAISNLIPSPFQDVYYGDQNLIPRFPALIAESDDKERDLGGKASTHRFALILRTMFIVYHEQIQASGITQKQTEEQAEALEDLLMQHLDLGGNVIFGMVARVTPGIVVKPGRVMLKATRLSYEAYSRQTF